MKPLTERQLHQGVAKFLDRLGILWFHPPNGGSRDPREARILKSMGVKPGVPDIIIVWDPMVAIELKTAKGRPSRHQTAWLTALRDNGWVAEIARSYDDVLAILRSVGILEGA